LNVLVIAAHPDDEVLGMGGTILKHTKQSDNVKIIFLATGITSRKSTKYQNVTKYETSKVEEKTMANQIKNLRNDSKKISKLLKVKRVSFYDFPDNEMDTVPMLQVVKVIEKELEKFKPNIVYTHHKNDLNIDHRITYQATLTACRPITNPIDIISFEVPSSTEWNYPYTFNPNYFVNVKKYFKTKLKAMQMYKHEMKKYPHPRSLKYLTVLAEKWGSFAGLEMAEAFEIVRKFEK